MFENMTVASLRNALDAKETTSVEMTKYCLEKIKKDKTNAFVSVFEEEALKDARIADKMMAEGKTFPLTGIPIAVKDNICTKGMKTTCASKMLADYTPPYDATAVSKLKAQGAVIIGKTNMDEFGMGSHNSNSYFGQVFNPLDTARSPGGSSGGSAAAVAAGLVPCALGSDTGGSVRLPASFCGIVGVKPTYGRVSRYGLIAYASSLDQIGVFAKNSADAMTVLRTIEGEDEKDSTSVELVKKSSKKDIKDMTLGIVREVLDCSEKDVADAVLDAAKYYEKQGAKLKEVSLPALKYALLAYYIIAPAEAASNLGRYDGVSFGHRSEKGTSYDEQTLFGRSEGFGDEVKKRIVLGNYILSDEGYDKYYKKALSVRAEIVKEYEEIFGQCDVILLPTSPTVAPLLDNKSGYSGDICTVSMSLAGLPTISLPCGKDKDDMPIGMSLVSRKFEEEMLFYIADIFENREGNE